MGIPPASLRTVNWRVIAVKGLVSGPALPFDCCIINMAFAGQNRDIITSWNYVTITLEDIPDTWLKL